MTEHTRPCARGCSLYRQHLTDCEGDPCTGCLPRRADHGLLCNPCHRRFETMLTDAPTVYRWLTGNLTGTNTAADKPYVTGTKGDGPPLPIKADIFDIRQLLADRLSAWVDDLTEDIGMAKPNQSTIQADSEFLLRWLQTVELCPWIGDWWTELAETMSDAHALAPWRPAPRRIPGVPCPGCGEVNLVIWGGETDVTCRSCDMVMVEERFALWERVLQTDVSTVA